MQLDVALDVTRDTVQALPLALTVLNEKSLGAASAQVRSRALLHLFLKPTNLPARSLSHTHLVNPENCVCTGRGGGAGNRVDGCTHEAVPPGTRLPHLILPA